MSTKIGVIAATMALCVVGMGVAHAEDQPLPSAADIRAMVDAGQYREALKPLFRVLSLQGPAFGGYDRYELLMLRAECQLQIKDQRATLDTLDQARKEAFSTMKPERAAAPTGMAFLIQHSNAYQYKAKSQPNTRGISILDKTLRPAACAALLADELPAAKAKVHALNGVKTMQPVLETAKLVGAMHALEVLSNENGTATETTVLSGQVTTNADRLMSGAMSDMSGTVDQISKAAQTIITEPQLHYDPVSRRSWMEQITRRRGPTDQDVQRLQGIASTCDKMHDSAVEMAIALGTDFETYKGIADKAGALKQKVAGVLNDNYMVVPP